MLGDVRSASNQGVIADPAYLHHVIRHQTVSPLNQFQGSLALADAALAHNQHALAEYVNQNAVDTDTGSQLHVKPADDFCHQGRGGLIRHKAGNAIVITEFQKVFIRLLVAAEHQTGNLAGCELIVHPALLLLVHGINICLLYVSDDLNPLPVKMVKETRELQGRTVHVRMGQHNLVRVNLRRGVFKLHFYD